MTVSVIVPIYNVEPYLRKCVDSILAQTHRELEVILVDDGSPDGCPAICDEYAAKDARVQVIHKANGGLSDARNAGLDAARGEWLSFIDSDDWIGPDMYETLLKNAAEHGAQMSVGGVADEVEENGAYRVVRSTAGEPDEALGRIAAMRKYFAGSWSAWDKIYRREVFDGIRFPKGEINEDEAIVLQLLDRCGTVVYTGRVFYHYQRRQQSITTAAYSPKKLAWYRHCRANLDWVQEHHPELEKCAAKKLTESIISSLTQIAIVGEAPYRPYYLPILDDLRANYPLYRSSVSDESKLRFRLFWLRYISYKVYCAVIQIRHGVFCRAEFWTVCYRKRSGTNTLLDDTDGQFLEIKNGRRSWHADPFVFSHGGHTYVFAEEYDLVRRKGNISYCELTENGAGRWRTALQTPFHLSYPFIFENENGIYMIPESCMADEIAIYKASDFPAGWVKLKTIVGGIKAVDSTLIKTKDRMYLLSQRLKDNGDEPLILMQIDDEFNAGQIAYEKIRYNQNERPAGAAFIWHDELIRPSQDCAESYGYALNMNVVREVSERGFHEVPVKKIIPLDVPNNLRFVPEGIHTYNFTSEYEVVDFKRTGMDFMLLFMRVTINVKNRLKKLFCRRK